MTTLGEKIEITDSDREGVERFPGLNDRDSWIGFAGEDAPTVAFIRPTGDGFYESAILNLCGDVLHSDEELPRSLVGPWFSAKGFNLSRASWAQEERDREKTGRIYFIQCGTGPIKIGTTDGSPTDRLNSLQTGSPERLYLLSDMPGSYALERELHVRFAAFRIRPDGEWFAPADELLEFIKSTEEPTP